MVNQKNIIQKYQYKLKNQYLYCLIDRSFQVVNRPTVLSFENSADTTDDPGYHFEKVEIKNCNVMIDG